MKPSLKLILDSSTPTLFLGLIQGDHILGHHVEVLDRQHAEWMLPRIIQFLNRWQLQLADITDVIVGHGPGSFTGVRLSLTLIKTLALLQPLQVYPINTLHLYAFHSPVIMLLDARGGRHYVAVYQGSKALIAPHIVNETALSEIKEQFPNVKSMTISDAIQEPEAVLQHLLKMNNSMIPIKDIQTLNPLYLKDLL
ncbi:MAG: tRNA (adenosine(37)-N6)-threonylcarbamoyltransferase complex dimerization subunit type 1 TsaB [Bacilli bacterium]